jgi:hypothetical protein
LTAVRTAAQWVLNLHPLAAAAALYLLFAGIVVIAAGPDRTLSTVTTFAQWFGHVFGAVAGMVS